MTNKVAAILWYAKSIIILFSNKLFVYGALTSRIYIVRN